MELSDLISLVVVLAVVITLSLIFWSRLVRRRMKDLVAKPKSFESIKDARISGQEFAASLTSEQIEEMVKARLTEYPDLAEVGFDFATGDDGSLLICIGEMSYREVTEIPDARIRKAIEEAVEEFNR
ncbi:MAG: hypothetical protein GTO14_25880 [Anaerolineales bacterium]|nr:hypothetical protein [Anaerolineales bacterium]